MQTYRLTVDSNGLIRVPNARPGQTVTVHLDETPVRKQLTLATASTPEERAEVIARLQAVADELSLELRAAGADPNLDLYDEDGLPA